MAHHNREFNSTSTPVSLGRYFFHTHGRLPVDRWPLQSHSVRRARSTLRRTAIAIKKQRRPTSEPIPLATKRQSILRFRSAVKNGRGAEHSPARQPPVRLLGLRGPVKERGYLQVPTLSGTTAVTMLMSRQVETSASRRVTDMVTCLRFPAIPSTVSSCMAATRQDNPSSRNPVAVLTGPGRQAGTRS